jgi:hypothetical protein
VNIQIEVSAHEGDTRATGEPDRFQHAHNLKDPIIDSNRLAQRIVKRKELIRHSGPDHCHSMVSILILGDQIPSTRGDLKIEYLQQFRCRPEHLTGGSA